MAKAHAKGAVERELENLNPDVLFVLAVLFPAERVKLHVFGQRPAELGARARSPRVKMLRPVVKLPENDPKTVLFSVHAVVKKAILPLIVQFQATTGSDKEKI